MKKRVCNATKNSDGTYTLTLDANLFKKLRRWVGQSYPHCVGAVIGTSREAINAYNKMCPSDHNQKLVAMGNNLVCPLYAAMRQYDTNRRNK